MAENIELTPRVFLVDDDQSIREVASLILHSENCQISEFNDGLEAWEKFQEDPKAVDGIITDFDMPRMNGLELAVAIKGVNPMLPVILFSGIYHSDQAKDIAKFTNEFFIKPFSLSKLRESIQLMRDFKAAQSK